MLASAVGERGKAAKPSHLPRIAQTNAWSSSSRLLPPAQVSTLSDRPAKRPCKPPDPNTAAVNRAAAKMDDEDVKGAIRQLCLTDNLAPPCPDSHRLTLEKHPLAPLPEPLSTFDKPRCTPHRLVGSSPGGHTLLPSRIIRRVGWIAAAALKRHVREAGWG